MTATASQKLHEAMGQTPMERAEVIDALLRGFGSGADQQLVTAWMEEAQSRIDAFDAEKAGRRFSRGNVRQDQSAEKIRVPLFAESECVEAVDRYDSERPGLGYEFAKEVNVAFERIGSFRRLGRCSQSELADASSAAFPTECSTSCGRTASLWWRSCT